jgi:predicted MFS family arabinose efflux permease
VAAGSTFSALRHRDLRFLWLGIALAYTADYLKIFAIGWLVVQIAERGGVPERVALYLGLLGLSRAVPSIASGLLGGAIADRVDRRRLLLATMTTSAAVAASLTTLVVSGSPSIALVMALTFAGSIADAFTLPTVYAVIPRLVPSTDLLSAIGLTNMMDNLSALTGPLLGGVLVVALGTPGPFYVLAPLYLAAIIVLSRMRPVAVPQAESPRPGILESLRGGIEHLASDPVLRTLVILSLLVSLFGRAVTQLYPAVVHDSLRLGAVALSSLLAGRAVGTLAGSLVTASLGGIARRGVAAAACVVAYGAVIFLFAAQQQLVPALAFAALGGAAQFIFSGLANGTLQSRAPDHAAGRMMSLYTTTITGGVPVGMLLLGSAGSLVGIGLVVAAGGVVLALGGVLALVGVADLRRYRAVHADPEQIGLPRS